MPECSLELLLFRSFNAFTMEIYTTYLIKNIVNLVFTQSIRNSNNLCSSLFKEFNMRGRNIFGPTSLNFAFQGLSYDTPDRSLHLSSAVTTFESRLSKNRILWPHNNFFLRFGLIFIVICWIILRVKVSRI